MSPQPPGLPSEGLHGGAQKGPFLNHSGKCELRLTKASARREDTGVLWAPELVRWDRHSDLRATGQGSSPGIPLHLYTQKLLSESKLTKHERAFSIPAWAPPEHVFIFKTLPHVSLACFQLFVLLHLQSSSHPPALGHR